MDFSKIKVVSNNYNQIPKQKYLVGLNGTAKDFCCQTILVSAIDESDMREIVKHLKPHNRITNFKVVNY